MTFQGRRSTAWIALVALGYGMVAAALGQNRPPARPSPAPRPPVPAQRPSAPRRLGLISATGAASPGYTLLAPLCAKTTYLVDLRGRVVHTWPSAYEPGEAAYLLEDGSLLRTAREPNNQYFVGGGIGGRIERIAPDGKLLWQFVYADENHCQHHDIAPLPNGHVLLIAWEKKTRAEALAMGLDPERMGGPEMWPATLIEVEPQGDAGGKIVWEWHVWDHLIQDFDSAKPNYGEVAAHPELVDLNYRRTKPRETPAEIDRLRSLGYVGGGGHDNNPAPHSRPPPNPADQAADWCHMNSVDYNAQLDQIMVSASCFNEVWFIDHSTTTQEAAGHSGGRYGHGGDLLYRFGNPWAYLAGDAADQMLFSQHDARWIPEGRPGAGHVTVFDNGEGRPDGRYSSVFEFVLPVDANGQYPRAHGGEFVAPTICWRYTAPQKADFFAGHLSGAQRLANGDTLICSGEEARLFEVSPANKIVWEFVNPYTDQPAGGSSARPPTANTPRNPVAQRPPPVPTAPPPGGPGGGLFTVSRYAPDYPGIRRILAMKAGS